LITKATNSLSEYVILTDFPLNNGYVSTAECYLILLRTLPVLFCFKLVQALNQPVDGTNLTTLGQTSLRRANAIIWVTRDKGMVVGDKQMRWHRPGS
jgi:hypothetical protein